VLIATVTTFDVRAISIFATPALGKRCLRYFLIWTSSAKLEAYSPFPENQFERQALLTINLNPT
jgi:hypothetical protein